MKPTGQEMEQALTEAARLEDGDDEQHLGKTLLYLHRRVVELERIRELTERYVLLGQAVDEHARLVRALQAAREHERLESGQDAAEFGLGGGKGT